VQHLEGIYWCPAPLRDEDQRSYKVRDVADLQAAPPPPVDEYVSDSTVGSDSEAPATLRRALSDGEIWTAHGVVNPSGLVVQRGGI
jgi:hypothetical protein